MLRRNHKHSKNISITVKKSKDGIFDYIIIGGGTSGGILAKKLTDDGVTSVLVLESGTNLTRETTSPKYAEAVRLSNNNRYGYQMFSNSPVFNRQSKYGGGRLIGGSSDVNGMYAVRGSKALYDEWASLVGSNWSYESVLPLFKENETYTGVTEEPFQRGREGPIFIRQELTSSTETIGNTFVLATAEVTGVPIVEDYNTGIVECTFVKTQFTQKSIGNRFIRSSTATGYLNSNIVTQGNQFNPNEVGINRKLLILGKTTANKVLIRKIKEKNTAYGVEYIENGIFKQAFARKEVVISAGIWSPVILQRSGIGDKNDLFKAGIKTMINNRNVGRNMQAHYTISMGIEVKTSRLTQIKEADPDWPAIFGAFLNMNSKIRQIQLRGLPDASTLPPLEVITNNWDFDPQKPTNIMTINITFLIPPLKGSVIVAHSDPEAYPTVKFNPINDVKQKILIVNSYLEVFKIVQKAREKDPSGIFDVVYPPEKIFNNPDTKEKRKELFRYGLASLDIFIGYGGYCKMSRSINDGVVDNNLKVFGIRNLRVADLSISPIVPDGNTVLPSMMIGLNAFQIIKNQKRNPKGCSS